MASSLGVIPTNGQRQRLLEPLTLQLPSLPPPLTGLQILHLTDLHVRGRRARWETLTELVAATEHDLLVLTGDYMNAPGDEADAHDVLRQLVLAAKPRLGAYGVFGNHDTPELRRRLAHLPVQWLTNAARVHPRLPLTLVGVDCGKGEWSAPRGDLVAAMTPAPAPAPGSSASDAHLPGANGDARFTLLLSHLPTWLPAASQMGIDLVLSGHTHGGQCRLPPAWVLYNATPGWPRRLSSGIYQHGRTLGLISRGVGESWLNGFRLFCPAHVPLITLQRGNSQLGHTSRITTLARW